MNMKDSDVLINLKPKSDFEKLFFANNEIKELKKQVSELNIEIGKLQAEKDEYKYQINKYINTNTKGDWKKLYQVSLKTIKRLRERIKSLQKTNGELILKVLHNK